MPPFNNQESICWASQFGDHEILMKRWLHSESLLWWRRSHKLVALLILCKLVVHGTTTFKALSRGTGKVVCRSFVHPEFLDEFENERIIESERELIPQTPRRWRKTYLELTLSWEICTGCWEIMRDELMVTMIADLSGCFTFCTSETSLSFPFIRTSRVCSPSIYNWKCALPNLPGNPVYQGTGRLIMWLVRQQIKSRHCKSKSYLIYPFVCWSHLEGDKLKDESEHLDWCRWRRSMSFVRKYRIQSCPPQQTLMSHDYEGPNVSFSCAC